MQPTLILRSFPDGLSHPVLLRQAMASGDASGTGTTFAVTAVPGFPDSGSQAFQIQPLLEPASAEIKHDSDTIGLGPVPAEMPDVKEATRDFLISEAALQRLKLWYKRSSHIADETELNLNFAESCKHFESETRMVRIEVDALIKD